MSSPMKGNISCGHIFHLQRRLPSVFIQYGQRVPFLRWITIDHIGTFSHFSLRCTCILHMYIVFHLTIVQNLRTQASPSVLVFAIVVSYLQIIVFQIAFFKLAIVATTSLYHDTRRVSVGRCRYWLALLMPGCHCWG